MEIGETAIRKSREIESSDESYFERDEKREWFSARVHAHN